MRTPNLADVVESNPQAAQAAFGRMNVALNRLLPDSPTHSRYQDVGSVGLAVVVAPGIDSVSYNPFDEDVLSKVSVAIDNSTTRPEAWVPLERYARLLGGEVPESMGCFTAIALAKINALRLRPINSSLRMEASVARGVVGLAGAQRYYTGIGSWSETTFVGASGLWEIHDHIVGRLFAEDAMKAAKDGVPSIGTPNDLIDELDRIFGTIHRYHQGIEAAEIPRSDLPRILKLSETLLDLTLGRRTA